MARSNTFRFKSFSVFQAENVPMRLGTDGVLLGAWTKIRGTENKVLDIGTGTGVIALQIAQRTSISQITGIDIDESAVACASENFRKSPWNSRLSAICIPLQKLQNYKYDLIVSNPPFYGENTLPPSLKKAQAKHTVTLSLDELAHCAEELLAPAGYFSLVLPVKEFEYFARITSLNLSRYCEVCSFEDTPPVRILAEFSRQMVDNIERDRIVIYKSKDEYSEQYKAVTRDFYLKF